MTANFRTTPRARGFSLIELMIVVAIIGIIAAIAVPNLLSSRRAANEGSAIGSMRSLNTAQSEYFATTGQSLNYGTLAQLNGDGLIDSILSGGTKSGYTYASTPSAGGATGVAAKYDTSAVPVSFNALTGTGTRGFYTNEAMVIYGKPGAAAGTRAAPGTPLQ